MGAETEKQLGPTFTYHKGTSATIDSGYKDVFPRHIFVFELTVELPWNYRGITDLMNIQTDILIS